MDGEKRFVRIDIAKAALDVFIGSGGAAFSLTNDEVGIRELLGHLAPGDFVILEATGGLEMPAASARSAAGIAVAIVNPRQVRDFARATGRLAKTDRLDAEVLARFGEAVRPEARPLANEQPRRSKHWLPGGASWSRCWRRRRIAGPARQRFYTVASMSTSGGWKSDFRVSTMNSAN
jgi:transposase